VRKVECRKFVRDVANDKGNLQEVFVEGVFHQWGCDYEEFDSGPGNYTVAIVELADGKIETFHPNNITFTTAA